MRLVLTAADLAHLGDLRSGAMQNSPTAAGPRRRDIPILCRDRVGHVGDAVAFIVADTRALAQDAGELIEVDYEQMRRSMHGGRARPGPPLVWPELGSNRTFLYEMGDKAPRPTPPLRGDKMSRVCALQQPAGLQLMERATRSASGARSRTAMC